MKKYFEQKEHILHLKYELDEKCRKFKNDLEITLKQKYRRLFSKLYKDNKNFIDNFSEEDINKLKELLLKRNIKLIDDIKYKKNPYKHVEFSFNNEEYNLKIEVHMFYNKTFLETKFVFYVNPPFNFMNIINFYINL